MGAEEGRSGNSGSGIDRGALWLHLATEDAVRSANAGDGAAARRRLDMARRVARAFAITGVVAERHVDEWSDDVDLAMAVRGCATLSVPPWWSRTPAVSAAMAGAGEDASAEHGDGAARRAAVSAYVRWLASALLAGWPRPFADASAVMREAAEAFRYAGVVDAALDAELQTAVDAVVARRFPAGWPAPPRSIGVRTGRLDVADGVLTTPTGRHRLAAVEGAPDSWVVEVRRDDGFLPVGQPVWAVDDRGGLYFGTAEGATDGEPRLRFQPGLQAAATEVEVLVGFSPEPARAAVAVSGLRAAL